MKIGIIGAGSISEFHLNSYDNNTSTTIYAICDINQKRADEKAERYGANKVYYHYKDLLADDAVEAVSICTYNNTHAEIAIAALNAGKHVLIEKPVSTTVEEALDIQEAVKRNNRVLQIGYVRRYEANTKVVKKFIDGGELGEIYYAKASYLRAAGHPGGWFGEQALSGGGPMIDLGVHVIDICWYLMGKPKVKSVSGNTYYKLGNRSNIDLSSSHQASGAKESKNTVEDLANALIRFENGATLLIDTSFSLHIEKDITAVNLFGDKGGIELEPRLRFTTEKHDTILNSIPRTKSETFDYTQAFQNEIDAFISSIKGETENISPIEDGVEIMKILEGVYKSAKQGVEIQYE